MDFLHDPCPSLSEYFLNFHSSKLEEGDKIGERFLQAQTANKTEGWEWVACDVFFLKVLHQ